MRGKFLIKIELYLYDTSFCVIYDVVSLQIIKPRLSSTNLLAYGWHI